jgi:hypothetical protein
MFSTTIEINTQNKSLLLAIILARYFDKSNAGKITNKQVKLVCKLNFAANIITHIKTN